MTTSTLTLTDFLLARIANDEHTAQAAGHGCGYLHEHNAEWVEINLPEGHNARPSYEMRQIRRWSPERVLAECEAKRRIVDVLLAFESAIGAQSNERTIGTLNGLRIAAKELALPYADHPDYDPDWRP